MNKKEFKSAEQYIAPAIEVIEVELSQNILQGSNPNAGLPGIGDGGDAW